MNHLKYANATSMATRNTQPKEYHRTTPTQINQPCGYR